MRDNRTSKIIHGAVPMRCARTGHLFDPSLQLDGKEHVGRFCDRVALKRARRARPAEREAVLEREEKGAARDRAVALRRNADDAEAATCDRWAQSEPNLGRCAAAARQTLIGVCAIYLSCSSISERGRVPGPPPPGGGGSERRYSPGAALVQPRRRIKQAARRLRLSAGSSAATSAKWPR